MPVTVVFDYPQRHRARRLRRWIATLAGGLMVFVGLVASIGVFPSLIYLVLNVWIMVGGASREDVPIPALDGDILLAAAISTTITGVEDC